MARQQTQREVGARQNQISFTVTFKQVKLITLRQEVEDPFYGPPWGPGRVMSVQSLMTASSHTVTLSHKASNASKMRFVRSLSPKQAGD